MKRIVTLTTDFGLSDHYIGSMKGVILGINPGSIIVDISHEIPKFNIPRAAMLVSNFYKYYPKDTIHVVVVDPGVGSERKPIVAVTDHGVFVGPDNGVFTYIMDEDCKVYEITNTDYMLDNISSTFHGRDIFAPVAAHLSLGIDPKDLGGKLDHPITLEVSNPSVVDSNIVGEVVYVDSFGNLVTNISGSLIEELSKIEIGEYVIDTVATSYSDTKRGELLAIIGSSGYLEISVNQGSASELIEDKKVIVIK